MRPREFGTAKFMARELHRLAVSPAARVRFAVQPIARRIHWVCPASYVSARGYDFISNRAIASPSSCATWTACAKTVGSSNMPIGRYQLMPIKLAPSGLRLELKMLARASEARRTQGQDASSASRTAEPRPRRSCLGWQAHASRAQDDQTRVVMKPKVDLLKLCAAFLMVLLLPVRPDAQSGRGDAVRAEFVPSGEVSLANTMDLLQVGASKGKWLYRIIHPLVVDALARCCRHLLQFVCVISPGSP